MMMLKLLIGCSMPSLRYGAHQPVRRSATRIGGSESGGGRMSMNGVLYFSIQIHRAADRVVP
jgi:hypothetical protein